MVTTEVREVGFPAHIKNQALLLDGHDYDDLRQAAKLVVQGEVIVASICGVMGFVCDGTQKGAERIFELKDRDRTKQLITAGSRETRRNLIDFSKLPGWRETDFDLLYDIPTFVIFPAIDGLPVDCTRPDIDDQTTNTVAIWWANHYRPITGLEKLMLEIRPEAFIEGSSCNRSDEESITDSMTAFDVFGKGSERVAAIVFDRDFDYGKGLIHGSHTMLRVAGDKIIPLRSGSVHTDSFKSVLGERLDIPVSFENQEGAVLVDAANRRNAGHYLRN